MTQASSGSEERGRAAELTRRPSSLAAKIVVVTLILDAFVVSLAGLSVYGNRKQYYLRAEIISRNLSAIMAENVDGYLDRIDFGLRMVVDGAEDQLSRNLVDATYLDQVLHRAKERVPEALGFWITDPEGNTRQGINGAPSPIDANVADRDYFIQLRDHPEKAMVISRPLVGRISGQWVMVLARRISAPDGRFAGIAYASIPITLIIQLFATVDLHPDDGITMRGPLPDLGVIARFPEMVGGLPAIGNPAVSPQLQAMAAAHPDKGTYQARAGIDGIERVLSYHRVGEYPYLLVVGISTRELIAEWRRESGVMAGLSLAFVVLTMVGARFALTSLTTRQALESDLRRSLAKSQTLSAALARKNAELGRFADVLAHHMQEPVRQQHIFAQHLARLLPKPLDPEVELSLTAIMDAAKRHRALLRDAQKYLALDHAQLGPGPAPADPALEAALDRLGAKLAQAGAEVDRMPLPTLPLATPALTEVFTQVLDNALTYARTEAAPRISVTTFEDGSGVVVALTDNGTGIPAEFRERVFGVFERLNPRLDQPGTGIGLALARKIVEAAGGRMWIEQPDGPGTRVCLRFPRGAEGA